MPFRSYKYELILNNNERRFLTNQMRWMLFTYNYFLRYNARYFKKHARFIPISVMKSHIPVLRNKHNGTSILTEPLIHQVIEQLSEDLNAYKSNPSKKVLYKKPYDSFRIVYKNDFFFDSKESKISFGLVKGIKLRLSRPLTGKILSIEISEKVNKWYVTFLLKTPFSNYSPSPSRSVGIDVGLKEFAILSDGTKIDNPRYYRLLESRFRKEQRKLSKKVRFSQNWIKQREKVQKTYTDLVNYRMNFLHQVTSKITDDFDVIGIEKLSILDMTKNKQLRKSILDASWGHFIKLLKYKAEDKGKKVVEVGRFYPSSQLCSNCRSKQLMPLHLRTYQCKNCGLHIDRDYNASINIEHKALEIYQRT